MCLFYATNVVLLFPMEQKAPGASPCSPSSPSPSPPSAPPSRACEHDHSLTVRRRRRRCRCRLRRRLPPRTLVLERRVARLERRVFRVGAGTLTSSSSFLMNLIERKILRGHLSAARLGRLHMCSAPVILLASRSASVFLGLLDLGVAAFASLSARERRVSSAPRPALRRRRQRRLHARVLRLERVGVAAQEDGVSDEPSARRSAVIIPPISAHAIPSTSSMAIFAVLRQRDEQRL